MSDRRAGLLAAGAIAAVAAGLLSAGHTPPLYDSIGVAGPYRYVCLPSGVDPSLHPQPDNLVGNVGEGFVPVKSVPVGADGKAPGIALSTDEAGTPQFQVLTGVDAFVLPAGAPSIDVKVTAAVPPQPLPTDGVLDGNVYTVSITSRGAPLSFGPGGMATVVLRGVPTGKDAVVEQLDGSTWKKLDNTTPVGSADTFGANPPSIGTFALVLPGTPQTHAAAGCLPGAALATGSATGAVTGGGDQSGGSGSGAPLVVVAVVAGALLLAGGLLILLRRSDRGGRSGPVARPPTTRPPGRGRRPPPGRTPPGRRPRR